MRVWREIPLIEGAVVTVGAFDGVHCGHQALLRRVVERAREVDSESVVVTFDPHPREALGSDGKFFALTTMQEKERLIAELGIDNLVILPFTAELAAMSQEEFVENILVERLGMKHFIVGYDNRFGRAREGSAVSAKELGVRLGFEVEWVAQEGEISSTKIREAILSGNAERVKEMLGR